MMFQKSRLVDINYDVVGTTPTWPCQIICFCFLCWHFLFKLAFNWECTHKNISIDLTQTWADFKGKTDSPGSPGGPCWPLGPRTVGPLEPLSPISPVTHIMLWRHLCAIKRQTCHCLIWGVVLSQHLPAHSLPLAPFFPKCPGGPLSPGRPLAPLCPGKPLSPGVPGGPGGPGFPGKPATPDSGLLKLAANWASCSVGARQKDNNEPDEPPETNMTPRHVSNSCGWQLSRELSETKHFVINHAVACEGSFLKGPKQLSSTRWFNSSRTRVQSEAERGETLVTISPELLLFSNLYPKKLSKLGGKEIILFISSNQRQKMYAHGLKGLILISRGSFLHGVLHLRFQFSVSWWKFMQPLLDCSFFSPRFFSFFFLLQIPFPGRLFARSREECRSAGGEINFSAHRV